MKELGEKIEGSLGLIITMIVIAIVVAISGIVIGLLLKGQTKLENFSTTIDSYEFKAYDDKFVSGDTVIAAIKNSRNPSPTKLEITVETSAGDTTKYGYEDDGDDTYSGYSQTDPGADDFINPMATFKSSLVKNNDVVTGITFEQQ